MASVDRLSALQDRRIASLSHTTTLIIVHDDSEAAADATRQALQLHRAGRSCIEVPLQNGFALVAEGDRDHAPAAAGATGALRTLSLLDRRVAAVGQRAGAAVAQPRDVELVAAERLLLLRPAGGAATHVSGGTSWARGCREVAADGWRRLVRGT